MEATPAAAASYIELTAGLPEIPLEGGDVTEGLVRVGDTIRRPAGPNSAAVQQLLAFLAATGFTGAPSHLGIDRAGRHVLSFIPGEVASRPWPAWLADDERALGVARLVRAYNDAVLPLAVPPWSRQMLRQDPPGIPASIAGAPQFIAHLDITPENVVFRDGRAHALIDFDLARPATRVEEVGNLLLWWSPLMPPEDRPSAVLGVDSVRRAGLLVDAYGLADADRARLIAVVQNQAERSWHLMKHRAETLGGGWMRMWGEGVGDAILRRQRWLADNAADLDRAVRGFSERTPPGRTMEK